MYNYGTSVGFWIWWAYVVILLIPVGLCLVYYTLDTYRVSRGSEDITNLRGRLGIVYGMSGLFLLLLGLLVSAFGPVE